MNQDARRYLGINCVLNGRSFIDAFDGSVEDAATGLDISVEEMQSLNERLSAAQGQNPLTQTSAITKTLLQFLRTQEYAFIYLGGEKYSLPTVAFSNREGELDDDVAFAVVRKMLRDVAFVDTADEIKVADGVIFVPEQYTKSLNARIHDAYLLYRDGPKGRPASFGKIRPSLTLMEYKPIPAKAVFTFLSDLASWGKAPTSLRDTTLMISDLYPVYEQTGCIMEKDQGNNSIYWLLDKEGAARSSVIIQNLEVLRPLMVTGLRDLANIRLDSKGNLTVR